MKLELQLFGGRGGGSGLSGGGASASVTNDWKTWTLGTEVTMSDRDVYAGEFGGGSRGQEFDGRVTDVADDHLIVTTYDNDGNKLADNWVDKDTAGIFKLKQTTQKATAERGEKVGMSFLNSAKRGDQVIDGNGVTWTNRGNTFDGLPWRGSNGQRASSYYLAQTGETNGVYKKKKQS